MGEEQTTFAEFNAANPCTGCSAPCCQVVLIPHKLPATFMDFDYIRYMLNFPHLEVGLSKAGEWSVIVRDNCRHFDAENHLCRVHGTDEKPQTCKFYNPHQCWYKPNFGVEAPDAPNLCLFSRDFFMHWLQFVRFSDSGDLTSAPDFDESKRILHDWTLARAANGPAKTPSAVL